jgi:hypothetical protein
VPVLCSVYFMSSLSSLCSVVLTLDLAFVHFLHLIGIEQSITGSVDGTKCRVFFRSSLWLSYNKWNFAVRVTRLVMKKPSFSVRCFRRWTVVTYWCRNASILFPPVRDVEDCENVSRMSWKSLTDCSLRFLLRISALTDDCKFILTTTASKQVKKQKK